MAQNINWSALYLGTFAELDSVEDVGAFAEDANLLVGQTFGGVGNELAGSVVNLDTDSSLSSVTTDNVYDPAGTITYDLGSGAVTSSLDTILTYSATLTFVDGTTATISDLVIIQDMNQNLFVVPLDSHISLDDQAIRSITFDSIHGNAWTSMTQSIYDDLDFVACFAGGTLIRTEQGAIRVEDLNPGDLVWTLDNGLQPLRFIGRNDVCFTDDNAQCRPILIKAGAFGPACPTQDLVLSPQHSVHVGLHDPASGEWFSPARSLIGKKGCRVMNGCRGVSYFSLMFDHHQVVSSNNMLTESFYPGPFGLAGLGRAQRDQVIRMFPTLCFGAQLGYGPPARPLLKPRVFKQAWTAGEVVSVGRCNGAEVAKAA